MSEQDPRERPDDPAGTKPKVDSASLVPAVREPLVTGSGGSDSPPPPDEPPPDLLPAVPESGGEPPAPAARAAEPPHAPRFQFLLGALFALGLAAIAAAVLLATEGAPEKRPEPAWSAWKPSAAETAPAEIAQHVAERYTHEGGRQLVNVTGGPLQLNGLPLQLVFDSGLSYAPIGGSGVLYNLCGIGAKDCRIAHGKPSAERRMLLEREIVELALYTFRYTDADNVVATLPLTADQKGRFAKQQDSAVLIQRTDVEPALERPLSATLTEERPSVATVREAPESVFIDQLLRQRRFTFRLQSGGVDGAYLVLRPPSA